MDDDADDDDDDDYDDVELRTLEDVDGRAPASQLQLLDPLLPHP